MARLILHENRRSRIRQRLFLTKYDKLIIMISNAHTAELTALLFKELP